MAFSTATDVETFALIDFHSDLETHLTNNIIPLIDDAIREYVGYDVDYANQLAQYQRPFTELGFLGSAFGYAPSIPSYTPAGGGGSVSPLQQMIGYGSLGLGALSGLKGIQGLF